MGELGAEWEEDLEAMRDQLLTQELVEFSDSDGSEAVEDNEGLKLVDAQNSFNEISRLVMLWTIRNRGRGGSCAELLSA